MKTSSAALCVSAALLCASQAASAAVIFSNGSFSSATPQVSRNYDAPNLRMFEDFVLGSGATLQSLEWNGGEYQHTGVSRVTSASIVIYAGAAPGSGAPVYSFSGAPTASFVGTFGASDRFDYSLSGLNLNLDAGTHYWLGLSVTLTGSQANWSNTTGSGSTIGGLYQSLGGSLPGSFYANENAAFRLLGTPASAQVPVPATLALVCLGLAGLGGFRRRALG